MASHIECKSKGQLVDEAHERQAERRTRPSHAGNGELEAERNRRIEAERVGKIKDEFLANLSHELRAPLNTIYGWSQLLRPGKSSDAEMVEGLAIIRRSVHAQVKLIDDLLDMSRIISGKLRLEMQRVDLSATIEAAVEAIRLTADAKGVRLEVSADPVACRVRGDPNRLQQVVLNLLSNAVKFTPRGGEVQVTLERVDSAVELSVSDTGQGIGPDLLPYVFDRFRQAESPSLRNNPGLGLGLTIVRNLVELHGGSVRAWSAGRDKGATFTVSLPILVAHTPGGNGNGKHPATETAAEYSADPDLVGVGVLVVDDGADRLDAPNSDPVMRRVNLPFALKV